MKKPAEDYHFNDGEVLLIDKPLTWTSFDVVKKIRYLIKAKVGHAGTLDPLATGLLILCTGKATKKIEEYMGLEKEYTGTFILGAVTPSYDRETEPVETFGIFDLNDDVILEATQQFIGEIDQVPPIYSALKVKGRPMYKMAREGESVKPEPRKVFIKSFEITNINLPEVTFKVVCSKGTYIRSLAYDFGKALNNGAYLGSLRRTRIGNFKVEDAWELEEFVNLMQSKKEDR